MSQAVMDGMEESRWIGLPDDDVLMEEEAPIRLRKRRQKGGDTRKRRKIDLTEGLRSAERVEMEEETDEEEEEAVRRLISPRREEEEGGDDGDPPPPGPDPKTVQRGQGLQHVNQFLARFIDFNDKEVTPQEKKNFARYYSRNFLKKSGEK